MRITNLPDNVYSSIINKMLEQLLDSGVYKIAKANKMTEDERIGAMVLAQTIRDSVYNTIKGAEVR